MLPHEDYVEHVFIRVPCYLGIYHKLEVVDLLLSIRSDSLLRICLLEKTSLSVSKSALLSQELGSIQSLRIKAIITLVRFSYSKMIKDTLTWMGLK